MGSTYTRQSTFTDGDTITADLFNTEFDQLVAAFAASSGHSHDGTAGEGGPIGGLITPGITLGDNTIDVTLTFDGGSNDGVLKWMEDEEERPQAQPGATRLIPSMALPLMLGKTDFFII